MVFAPRVSGRERVSKRPTQQRQAACKGLDQQLGSRRRQVPAICLRLPPRLTRSRWAACGDVSRSQLATPVFGRGSRGGVFLY